MEEKLIKKIQKPSKPIKKIISNGKNKKTTITNYNTDKDVNKTVSSNVNYRKEESSKKTGNTKISRNYSKSSKIGAKRQYNKSAKAVKVVFLGGLNQIGKNITAFECNNEIIIVDCGMSFPDGEMLGVDLVIPDFSYLEANREKIKGLVITHGMRIILDQYHIF